MKHVPIVLVLVALLFATPAQAGDGGSADSGVSGVDGKVSEHKRVQAIYWKGGYIISRADEKTDLKLGEKKKPATKPVAKK